MSCHLYELFRPGQFDPFYIGLTEDHRTRFGAHRCRFGKDIVCKLVAVFPSRLEAEPAETRLIQGYLTKGLVLENVAKTPRRKSTASEAQKRATRERWARYRLAERSSSAEMRAKTAHQGQKCRSDSWVNTPNPRVLMTQGLEATATQGHTEPKTAHIVDDAGRQDFPVEPHR